MFEIRGTVCSLWINNKCVEKEIINTSNFHNFKGPHLHIAVDFEKNDGETVYYYGYDELPIDTPEFNLDSDLVKVSK